MRKNGVNRQLTPIEGGVCAPASFMVNAVHCGIRKDGGEQPDLGLIMTKKRCSVACIFSQSKMVGAPIRATKRHLQSGYARAIIVNGGVANVWNRDGELFAENVCRALDSHASIALSETVIASTGTIGGTLRFSNFENAMGPLVEGLQNMPEKSELFARAIADTNKEGLQISYSFDLGAFPCKIGAVFKGNRQVSPNMATFLAFITTDVNISPEMLQKALSAEAKDSFNLLTVDGTASPNDTVCILANGEAGNYKIDRADSEYEKFCYILHEVATEICRRTAKGASGVSKSIVCKVTGAKSKQAARAVCKAVVCSIGVKRMVYHLHVDAQSLLCAIGDADVELRAERLRVSIKSARGELVVYDGENSFSFSEEIERSILCESEIEICVVMREGNYSAEAFGCDLTDEYAKSHL